MEHFTSVCAVLFELLGNSFLPNSAELMGMYGRVSSIKMIPQRSFLIISQFQMCINSFNICNQDFQCIGTGIYLAASIIDHSCDPNAVAIFEGTTLNIRNTKPIEKLDFTQVSTQSAKFHFKHCIIVVVGFYQLHRHFKHPKKSPRGTPNSLLLHMPMSAMFRPKTIRNDDRSCLPRF